MGLNYDKIKELTSLFQQDFEMVKVSDIYGSTWSQMQEQNEWLRLIKEVERHEETEDL